MTYQGDFTLPSELLEQIAAQGFDVLPELIAQRGIPLEFLQPLTEIVMDAEFAAWLKEADSYQSLGFQDGSPAFPESFCFPGYRAFFANRLSTGKKSLGLLSCYRVEEQPFSLFKRRY